MNKRKKTFLLTKNTSNFEKMLSKYIVLLMVLISILPVIFANSIPKPDIQIQPPVLIVDPLPAPVNSRAKGSWSGKRNLAAIKQNKRIMPDIIIDFDKLKSD